MTTTAKTGIGLQLKRGAGNTPSETFTAIAMVKSIKGPSEEASTIDVTSLDSTGGHAEFIQGLKSGGQLVAEANFDPTEATYINIRADFQGAVTHNYEISGSTPFGTRKFTFAAFPIKLDHSFEPKAASNVSITLQITGQVSLGT